MKTHYHFVQVSENMKTGPIPVVASGKQNCPTVCPIYNQCYANKGNSAIHWRRLTNGHAPNQLDFASLLSRIKSLWQGAFWRYGTAGDLPGDGNRIDSVALASLVESNKGKNGFCYTHKPVIGNGNLETDNRAAIRFANSKGFRINLSANNPSHADQLSEADCGPVACIVSRETPDVSFTPAGRKIVICPAQQREGITCQTCKLCSKERSVIVGFRAHGTNASIVEELTGN